MVLFISKTIAGGTWPREAEQSSLPGQKLEKHQN